MMWFPELNDQKKQRKTKDRRTNKYNPHQKVTRNRYVSGIKITNKLIELAE